MPRGGSQVSGTRVVCLGAVVGERRLPGGTGPFGAPKPPWQGPFGGLVGVCACVCACVWGGVRARTTHRAHLQLGPPDFSKWLPGGECFAPLAVGTV